MGLARLQMDPRKALQSALRGLHAAHVLPHIQLGHLIPGSIAGICHIDGDMNVAVAAGCRRLN